VKIIVRVEYGDGYFAESRKVLDLHDNYATVDYIAEQGQQLLLAAADRAVQDVRRIAEKENPPFYLLVCRTCAEHQDPVLPIPFGSAQERGKWASEHTAGTGHDSWLVWEEARRVRPDMPVDGE
jgi:hypothetical protein